jgi:predicted PurR-regulated permease PerM
MYRTPPEQNELNSPSWSAVTRYFVLALIIIAVGWLAVIIAPLLQTVGIAALLALLLNPLVHWAMNRLRLPRTWAAATVFFVFLVVLLGVPIGLGSLAVTQWDDLNTDLLAAIAELQQWILQPVHILGYHIEPTRLLASFESSLSTTLTTLPRGSLNLLSSVTANLLLISTVFVTLYYFLKDGPRIKPWFLDHIPLDYRPEASVLVDRLEEIWGRFLRIQLLLLIVLITLLMLGTLLVIGLFRSGLVRWSPLGFVLLLLAVYTVVQQIDNLWLRPQYMGRHLQLHPGIVFVGLIAGLAFGGILGAIVAVPAIATARIVGRYLYYRILGLPPSPQSLPQNDKSKTLPGNQEIVAQENTP